jgi:hypothetical protein
MVSTAALAQRDEGSLALRARSPGRPPLRSSERSPHLDEGSLAACCRAVLLEPIRLSTFHLSGAEGGRGNERAARVSPRRAAPLRPRGDHGAF